jgi:hypothetical protein
VFVCDVAGGTGPEEPGRKNRAGRTGPDRTGVYFLKNYAGFAEFVGAKILYTLALSG